MAVAREHNGTLGRGDAAEQTNGLVIRRMASRAASVTTEGKEPDTETRGSVCLKLKDRRASAGPSRATLEGVEWEGIRAGELGSSSAS